MNITPPSRPGIGEIIIRSLVVGFVYALASALVAAILGPMSRLTPTPGNILVWLLTGTLVCLSLSPFILNSNGSRTKMVLAVWGVQAFVRSLGLGIEGSLFKPTAALNSILGAIFGILVSLLVAWLAVLLLMPAAQISEENAGFKRSWWDWTWRVLAVGLAYFIFYFVFGATNALLYTQSFYKNNPQYGLSLPSTGIIFLAQLLRGPLFGLGSLFIVRATNAPRRQLAVWLGILLFIIGGVGPYVEVTLRTMPLGFNLATLAEIFFQNFLTGIVAANLFRPRDT
ncbi:MAG TPA: hypothetical protein VK249_21645 [Anaerolineales bacterium]|nr:hypothetical protein [Anaerolineales bacterium]